MDERRVIILGDGPTGLSAALLLAKTGFDVQVVGMDATPVRKAMLHNLLGDDGLPGPDYVDKARQHAERYGARLVKARVERVEPGTPLRVVTDRGTLEGDWLVLATGFERGPAQALGLQTGPEGGVLVDVNGRTSRERVYAGGSVVRGAKSQVATSVGDGAAIAVDLLSLLRGKPRHDYDVLKPKPQGKPAA